MEIHNRGSSVCSSMAKKTINSKRPPLADLTNHQPMASCEGKIPKTKNRYSCSDASIAKGTMPESTYVKSSVVKSSKDVHVPRSDRATVSTITAAPIKSCEVVSPSQSTGGSVSSDESMSICDSLESLEFECIDDCDDSAVTFIEKKTRGSLTISNDVEIAGDIYKDDSLVKAKTNVEVVNIDVNSVESTDPQFCATIESEIYNNLRALETKMWPSVDYMERIQSDINASMRSVLVDWLVEVAEEYMLLPETLFLAVNYIDRYLSGNDINRERLQLLGVACMLIASKYEEICAPQVKDLSYITDCTYSRDEVLQMESDVLNYLKFEISAVTARCFLWCSFRAAQDVDEVPSMQLECLASYLSELSLLEYKMICYSPSLIAASATFLAKFILKPSVKPWTMKLKNYTLYGAADLRDSVKALHCLFRNSNSSGLPAIRDKYSVHKYKFVAKKYCPLYIPPEYFV